LPSELKKAAEPPAQLDPILAPVMPGPTLPYHGRTMIIYWELTGQHHQSTASAKPPPESRITGFAPP